MQKLGRAVLFNEHCLHNFLQVSNNLITVTIRQKIFNEIILNKVTNTANTATEKYAISVP